MIFGSTFMGADVLAVPNAPSNISNITSCTISNAYFDDFYITENTEKILTTEIPQDWDNETILHGKYDEDTGLSAGSVNFRFDDIADNYLLVKRRAKDSMKWITLHAYHIRPNEEIEGVVVRHYEDLNQTFIDYTCAPGVEYEYAIVPVIGNVEGTYYASSIVPETKKLVVCTSKELWATLYTDGNCNNQRNTAPGVVNTLNNKYPTTVDNSISNYETVDVTAQFYPTEDDGCTIIIDPDNPSEIMRLIKRFKDFLMNRKNKFLKNLDGRIWFCYVTTPPSDNAKDAYYDREVTFGVTEIADVEDEEALYNAGFITATSEWWNK